MTLVQNIITSVSLSIILVLSISTSYDYLNPKPIHRTFSSIPPAVGHYNNTTYTHPVYTAVKTSGLSSTQQEVVLWAFEKGLPSNLGYTMAAIAMHESYAGIVVLNLNDPSFGIFHNLITSVLTREGLSNTSCNRNRTASKLILDRDYAASQALAELLHWKKRYKDNWSKTVMSYNAGTKYLNGKNYLIHIRANIALLKGPHDAELHEKSLRVFHRTSK